MMDKPWDSPKIQMIIMIFSGTVTQVTPINIVEVRANGEKV